MSHHLSGFDQQGNQGKEHADEGCILEQHLFESIGFHVGCSDYGHGKQADCSRPAELSIEEVHDSLLEGFLMHLLFRPCVFLDVVPLPISRPVLLRHQLSILNR